MPKKCPNDVCISVGPSCIVPSRSRTRSTWGIWTSWLGVLGWPRIRSSMQISWILVGGNLQRNHETNIGLTLPETYFGGFDWFWFGLVRDTVWLQGRLFWGKIWWLHGFSLWYDLGSRRICFLCSFLPTPISCSWIDLFVWCFVSNLLVFITHTIHV